MAIGGMISSLYPSMIFLAHIIGLLMPAMTSLIRLIVIHGCALAIALTPGLVLEVVLQQNRRPMLELSLTQILFMEGVLAPAIILKIAQRAGLKERLAITLGYEVAGAIALGVGVGQMLGLGMKMGQGMTVAVAAGIGAGTQVLSAMWAGVILTRELTLQQTLGLGVVLVYNLAMALGTIQAPEPNFTQVFIWCMHVVAGLAGVLILIIRISWKIRIYAFTV